MKAVRQRLAKKTMTVLGEKRFSGEIKNIKPIIARLLSK
jgi:hypothetical protein